MARVLLLLAALVVVAIAMPDDKYTTKYDNINIEDTLGNERLLKKAVECLLDEGGCTPDVLELKKVLADALKNSCSKCSDKQKAGSKTVLKFLIDKKPEYFDKLEKKYDPEGTYRKQYKEEAAKQGLKI